jgi:sugar fermentation stimulation protein A
MDFEALTRGVLIKRYKRFMADIRLEDGSVVTAHLPNTGSMKSTRAPGSPVALSYRPAPHRKLAWTLEMIQAPGGAWVGVNTMYPNRIVAEAVASGRIGPLRGYSEIRREVSCGRASRIDLMLRDARKADCYVEVKNVTYREGRWALFPDAVTERGTRHLLELAQMVAEGKRAVIFFLVNRRDCQVMGPAHRIDPVYADTLWKTMERGVEALAYRTHVDLTGIRIDRKIAVAKWDNV